MTRYNLHEAVLLDVSGELSAKTQEQLHAHLSQDMAARAKAEEIGAGFALLMEMRPPVLTRREAERIAGELKMGIRREVGEISWAKASVVRRRFIYGALTGISSVAACLLVALSVVMVVQKRAHNREQAIAKAEDSIHDFMYADADNMTDVALASLKGQISKASDLQEQWSPTESSGNRARLLELVDPTPDEETSNAGT